MGPVEREKKLHFVWSIALKMEGFPSTKGKLSFSMSSERQLPKKALLNVASAKSTQNHIWYTHLRQNFKTEAQSLVTQLNEHGFEVNPLASHMANMFA